MTTKSLSDEAGGRKEKQAVLEMGMRLQRKADLSLGCLEPGLRPVDNGESATSFFRGKKYNQIFNVAV